MFLLKQQKNVWGFFYVVCDNASHVNIYIYSYTYYVIKKRDIPVVENCHSVNTTQPI